MKIKIITKYRNSESPDFEYAPGYVFTFDTMCEDYDWLLVFDELFSKSIDISCPRQNTILATWEPVTIKCYTKAYAGQFGHLLSNRPQSAERHKNYHLGRGYYWCYNGRTHDENRTAVIPEKSLCISAVCSSKAMKWTRHYDRVKLMNQLYSDIPGLDWYGYGVKYLGKKFEALDKYKYHVAIENHIAPGYWSEKISDALLCECLPFYAGDPLLSDVLPRESFIPIPLDDPKEASKIIRDAIDTNQYEKRKDAILESKKLLLEKYNLWAQVIDLVTDVESKRNATDALDTLGGTIYSRKAMRKRSLFAAIEAGFFHLKQYTLLNLKF